MQEYNQLKRMGLFWSDFILVSLNLPKKESHTGSCLTKQNCLSKKKFHLLGEMSYGKFHSRDVSVIGATKESQLQYTLANPFVSNLHGVDGEQV